MEVACCKAGGLDQQVGRSDLIHHKLLSLCELNDNGATLSPCRCSHIPSCL